MSERDRGKNKSRLTGRVEIISSSVIVGTSGGVSYGITRFVSDPELAEKVGVGVGGTILGLLIAAIPGKDAEILAEKYAIQGKVKEAVVELVKASAKGALGLGISGSIPAYEGAGLRGAAIGGMIGSALGAGVFVRYLAYVRELGKAYRDIIHPVLDPKNFPKFDIIKDELFDDEDILLENPPVYIAGSIADMQGFRQAQVYWVAEQSKSLSKRLSPNYSSNRRLILDRMASAIFIIPDVSHFPAYDPPEKPLSVRVQDLQDNLIVGARKSPPEIWDYNTAFAGKFFTFDEKRWKYWKDNSWKHDVAILVERKSQEIAGGSEEYNLDFTDSYYLIDIITNVPISGSTEKEKEKLEEIKKVRGLRPVWKPTT